MAARWSSENVVVEFRDAQVLIDYALLKPTSVSTLMLLRLLIDVVWFTCDIRKDGVQSISDLKRCQYSV